MKKRGEEINNKKLIRSLKIHKHSHPLVKFLGVFLVVIIYSIISIFKFGLDNGILVSFLTWSFFVLCTPIADAGILLDFPLRMIAKIRMIYSEIFVWIIAISSNIFVIIRYPWIYEKTFLLILFKHILLNPIPFWSIIILSAIGTFLSLYFGDEIIDLIKMKNQRRKKYLLHKEKYKFVIYLFILTAIFMVYKFLIDKFRIKIPLI